MLGARRDEEKKNGHAKGAMMTGECAEVKKVRCRQDK